MIDKAFALAVFLLFSSAECYAFQRVECMDRPDGSVYIFKRVPGQPDALDVRIYHGWQATEYSFPGLPIGIEDDFLNARYDVRTPEARRRAIAGFTPLERLIYSMDTVFHHRFRGCLLGADKVDCREENSIKVGSAWISGVEFFFMTQRRGDPGPDAAYTVGIRGRSLNGGLESSGRRYFKYGRFSECLFLQQHDW